MSLAPKTALTGRAARSNRKLPRFAGRWAFRFIASTGLAALLVAAGAIVYAQHYYQVTLTQLVVKGLDRYDILAPWLVRLLSPAPAFPDHVTDGEVKSEHPRIVVIDPARLGGRSLLESYERAGLRAPRPPCGTQDYLFAAICWSVTGNEDEALKSIAALGRISVNDATDVHDGSSADDYSKAWRIALTYDLVFDHPAFGRSARGFVERELEKALRRRLIALDGDSLSLWHSRSTTAQIAFLTAIVLTQNSPERAELFRRAQAHFLESMRAIALTEGWPEGYNYWINSRGFLAALAALAYVQGQEGAKHAELVKNALSRAAYWTIHATRPDNRVEGMGDEGPRVDLKDETRRVIDLIARITRDPVLSSYSRYLASLHRESYYRGHQWSFFIANDPTVLPAAEAETNSLRFLQGMVPNADWFGRGAFDQVFMRSGWGPDDTFIGFRAGRTFTHHGHYDAGHFTLFKGAPLAINSSVYEGDVFSPNRLNYSIRTIAKNSLLILRPGETVRPNRFFETNVADGGQRVVMPTGSAIVDLRDWRKKLIEERAVDGGTVTAFSHFPSLYTYVASDLTAAYNTPRFDTGGTDGKVRRIRRALLYLNDQDILIVRDSVYTVRAGYTKKWLLHTIEKPELPGSRVLRGTESDGIMASRSDRAIVRHDRGTLLVRRLLPRDAEMRLVGGTNHRFYVEADGDDSDLDGLNMAAGAVKRRWFDNGHWRIEIQPGEPRESDRFLVVLTPGLDHLRIVPLRLLELSDDRADGVSTGTVAAIFLERSEPMMLSFRSADHQTGLIVTGLASDQIVHAATSSGREASGLPNNGVAFVEVDVAPGDDVTVSVE